MTVAVWVGASAPLRTIRWLDGALSAAAKFTVGDAGHTSAIAIAAGESTWLDLAADRASRAGIASVGIETDLQLDYLGWAQLVAAAVRHLGATTVLVDEASRPERFPEVSAIAELLDTPQLTRVIALAPDGAVIHASRAAGSELQTVRIKGDAVIGIRIAGPAIEDYPTPTPSASMKRLDIGALNIDVNVIGHRSLPPRASREPRRTVDRVAEHLAVHVVPRGPR